MYASTTSNEIPRGVVVNNNWDGNSSSSSNNNNARAPAYPVAFGGPYDADYDSFYATADSAATAAALDAEETSPNAGVITAATSSSAAVAAAGSFPQKLHRMLCDAPSAGFEDVCAWVVNGTAFRIHDPQRFVEEVMPRYFSQQTKYKSFQRMLNIYNFLRVPHGPNKGCYAHKNFVRSQPHLAATIQRYNHKAWKRNRQERLRQLQLQQQKAQQSGAIVTPPYARPVAGHHLKQHSFSSSMLYTDEVLNDAATAAAMTAEEHEGNRPSGSGHGRPGVYHQHNRTLSMDLFRDLEMDSILKDVVFDGTGANGTTAAGGGHQNRHHPTFSSMSFFSVSSCIDADDPDRINHDLNGVLDLFQENEYAHNTHDNNNSNYCSSTSSSSSTMDDELREYEQQMDERFFPIKLYDMLEAAENNEHVMSEGGNPIMMKSIISWLHDGTAFKVLDTKAFTKYIMPLYFDQTQYESFRRQLNMYGFIREPRGINRGTYHHPSFRRGYRQECRNNIFRRAPGSGGASGAVSKKNNTEAPVPNVTAAVGQSAW